MKIGVCGAGGRMGAAILNIMFEKGHIPAAAFDAPGSPFISKSTADIVKTGSDHCTISSINSGDIKKTEGIIDFSSPSATFELIEIMAPLGIPLVIGTTGFTDQEFENLQKASSEMPVLFSPNMSLAVNLLFKLTEIASSSLNMDYDVEIFEAHHKFKKDAPSGTARKLIEVVKKNMPGLANAKEVHGREGIVGERGDCEIGVHAMRGGSIVGEHTVFFTSADERIELTHRAATRDTFARGAVTAMEFLKNKPAGFYNMFDVLGL